MNAKLVLAGFFLLLVSVAPAFAAFPGDWWGRAYVGSDLAPDGTPVSAYIDGELYDTTLVGERIGPGYYELIVSDADEGDTIVFKIGSVEAQEGAVFSDGSHEQLDLTLAGPACGDTLCNGEESSSTCPEDCPPAQTTSSSSSSHSSSSSITPSSSSSSDDVEGLEWVTVNKTEKCSENWTCEDWSECINGFQTRVCIDLNDCSTFDDMPPVSQECDFSSVEVTCGDGICSPGEICEADCAPKTESPSENGDDLLTNIFTGRFLTSPTGIGIGILLLLLIGLGYYFFIYRKKKKTAE
ncbi:MAG: hypothetical protein JW727_04545 [Candidatus Aenigmarchaeota archaeon]|nr:hypothetical protein [Candidatus Aenigmarchaeota archaeon]